MALTTGNPFNQRIETDANYIVSSSIQSPTNALDFIQAVPYPTTTERTLLNVTAIVANSTGSGITSSIYLQHSADNVNWVNIPQKAAPFISIFSNAASTAFSSSVLTSFEPDGKRYVRGSSSFQYVHAGDLSALTGSVNLTVQF